MAAQIQSRRAEPFRIHEDVPSTEDTQVNEDLMEEDDEEEYMNQHIQQEDQRSELSDSDISEDEAVDLNVQMDMEKLQKCFPGFKHKYRLIKRIGEGTFDSMDIQN